MHTNTTPEQRKNTFSTHTLVTMAMFASILCISSYISIPLPNGMHLTALNFVITIIILLFPLRQACTIVSIWLLIGAVGVPVYIGGTSGLGYLFSANGGYTLAFLLVSILIPLMNTPKYNRIRNTFLAVLSVILVDLIGCLWLMYSTGISFPAAIMSGFLPFLVPDLLKAVCAAWLIPHFRQIIHTNFH